MNREAIAVKLKNPKFRDCHLANSTKVKHQSVAELPEGKQYLEASVACTARFYQYSGD